MKLKILDTAHHRNGICGAPFTVVLLEDIGPECSRKVAILFEQDAHCAILDVDKLAKGDIAFGSNSWRGDTYEPHLRQLKHDAREVEIDSATSIASCVEKCDAVLYQYSDKGKGERAGLIDLLTDAMHWCDEGIEDFHFALALACKHYLAELNGEQTEERRMS